MSSVSRDRDRERLEQELQTDEYQELLTYLQRGEPLLRQFRTWMDVIAFMRAGTSRDPRKDEILRPIFNSHGEDQDPRWRTILLTIFWPGLESIHSRKWRWDPDPDELWQIITWTFLQMVCRIDVQRRPERIVQKLINDTFHHLHDEYRRVWTRAKREPVTDSEKIEALAGAVERIDLVGIDLRRAQGAEIRRLRKHLDAGRISEADFFLLVGTRIYGQSIADFAREAGLNYQVAKKRRQRAWTAIRRFEGKSS